MPPEQIHDTFLGLPPDACGYEQSHVVLVRAPYDGTASYRAGARGGPAAIMAASTQVETWDVELGRSPCDAGIHTLPALAPVASGPEAMVEAVAETCRRPAGDGKLVFTLGGEHTVTAGAARAVAAARGDLSFLQIDAHLDLRREYEGSAHSHACVAQHLLPLGPLVQVGVRCACPEELAEVARHGLDPFWAWDLARRPVDRWVADVVARLGPRVYVTLDVDGLDPAVIPATGTPVPGGLGWYETLALLRAVGSQREVVGCDLVELAPGLDGGHRSAFAAALLAYKMVGYFVR